MSCTHGYRPPLLLQCRAEPGPGWNQGDGLTRGQLEDSKTALAEDSLTVRQKHSLTRGQEDSLTGGQPHRRTASQEDRRTA